MEAEGLCRKSPKSQENRFINWPYELQEAISNRKNGFLHSPKQFLGRRVYTCVEVMFELVEKITVKCFKK